MLIVGMAGTQPNNNGEDERVGVWEEALRRVREKDAAELASKKKEAEEKMMAEREEMLIDQHVRRVRFEKKLKEAKEQRQKEAMAKYRRSLLVFNAKRERENRLQFERVANEARLTREEKAEEEERKRMMENRVFFDSVVQVARDLREKEEEEEEETKRKAKGKGPCSTQ